jgi:glycosyltransferase involved in cell wall biosynthesis
LKVANTNITLGLPIAIARENWEVVHTYLPTPWAADWSAVMARLLGRACVLSFYNDTVGDGFAKYIASVYRATVFRLSLHLADCVIVASDYWRDDLLSVNHTLASRIVVIPNGVDLNRFTIGPQGNGRQLLFVGILDRYHRYKGLDVLLHSLARVTQEFELTIVGEGDLRSEYEQLAETLGINTHTHFEGHLSDQQLERAYQASDIYILPSDFARQEGGFTLTALEAMACGLPVILADGAGQIAREAAEAGAGIRVPVGDAESLAKALNRLLGDSQQRRDMGRAARSYVEANHSWEVITERRRAVYIEAVDAARARCRFRNKRWN